MEGSCRWSGINNSGIEYFEMEFYVWYWSQMSYEL